MRRIGYFVHLSLAVVGRRQNIITTIMVTPMSALVGFSYRTHFSNLLTLLFAVALSVITADGSAAPVGREISVSSGTTVMTEPAIAMNRGGRFVVVWEKGSNYYTGTVRGSAIMARVYNANGVPLTNQFVVNTTTAGGHWTPDVAMDAHGNFVVVWACGENNASSDEKIYKRSFYADGRPMGGEVLVNRPAFYFANHNPAIVMNADGEYVVAWGAWRDMWPNPELYGLFGQRYAADGARIGDEFRVDGNTGIVPVDTNVSIAINNSVVIAAWDPMPIPGGYPPQGGIHAQRFDTFGASLEDEFAVASNAYHPGVALLNNGSMVVVWNALGRGVQGRLYDASGVPVGSPFTIANSRKVFTGDVAVPVNPAVYPQASGGFGAAYWGADYENTVRARRFTASGKAIEADFLVANRAAISPDIAFSADDDFVVVWQSWADSPDGLHPQIKAKLYDSGPAISVVANDPVATEAGLTPGVYTFTRTGSTAAELTVNFSVGGTATSGSDYLALGSLITFPVGAREVRKRLTPLQDAYQEYDETVTLRIKSSDRYRLGSPASATITLVSDEAIRQTVTVAATDNTATEAGLTPAAFTFTRTGSTAAALTVGYSVGGNAIAGSDYRLLGDSITFPIGASRVTRLVRPVQDTLHEANESVVLRLTQSARYAVGSPGSASVVITSDE